MKSHSWNISLSEGDDLLTKLLLGILHQQSDLTIGELGTALKEHARNKCLFFTTSEGKRRNINQYIRNQFGGIYSFVDSKDTVFKTREIPNMNKQYTVSLQPNVKDDLDREEAEKDDFIWISASEEFSP